jgi:4a-hydroxytetrahydrobiopterin dehydratase
MDLTKKKCKPCEGGIPKLTALKIEKLKKSISDDWQVVDDKRLTKRILFVNFRHTMDFVNRVADLAEEEGHHPILHVTYSDLVIDLYTHAINGLSENDFILAAKIDKLPYHFNY